MEVEAISQKIKINKFAKKFFLQALKIKYVPNNPNSKVLN